MKKVKKPRHTNTLSSKEYDKLHKLYTEFSKSNNSTFRGVSSLQKASKLPRTKVLQYLHSSPTYTKLKTPTRKFKRLKAVSPAIDEIWSMDLAYVDKLARYNDNVHYLLVCVDVLSRFLRIEPLVNKEADTAKEGLQNMTKRDNRRPHKIWVDNGTEFLGEFGAFCRKNDIVVYSTHSETKSALAERYIRTVKGILYKYLLHKTGQLEKKGENRYNLRKKGKNGGKRESMRYIDNLQDVVNLVNNSVNRSIDMAPAKVTKAHTKHLLKLQQLQAAGRQNPSAALAGKKRQRRFKVDDVVRVAEENLPFKKGYKRQFTDKLYVVRRVVHGYPPTYELKTFDEPTQVVLGKFYRQELVKFIPQKPVARQTRND